MIYLNNAATSFPKPPCVLEAVTACLNKIPDSQYRSGQSIRKGDGIQICRKNLGMFLKIADWKKIVFTSGATEALNEIICGLDYRQGEILATQTEHNSVLRPLYNQQKTKGLPCHIVPCDSKGAISAERVESSITPRTRVLFISHCSNVTGMIQNLKEIADICHRHGVLVIADASQSAGCISIDTDGWNLDGVVFTGHKSLFGIQGTGGYYLRDGISLIPLKYGGTGRDSAKLTYEGEGFEYEVGTMNQPGIEALNAGIKFLLECGITEIEQREKTLMKFLFEGIQGIPRVVVYGKFSEYQGPVVSFNIQGMQPADVAYILQNGYDINVRAGLHCAPLIHSALKTEPYGTVRVSVSYMTQKEQIIFFLQAIEEITNSLR